MAVRVALCVASSSLIHFFSVCRSNLDILVPSPKSCQHDARVQVYNVVPSQSFRYHLRVHDTTTLSAISRALFKGGRALACRVLDG